MRTRSNRRTYLAIAVVFALSLIASSCSGSATTTLSQSAADDDGSTNQSEPAIESAPTQAPEPTAASVPTEPTAVPEPTATPEPAPVFFGSELQVGDCFNRLPDNPVFQPPDLVACDEFHQEELYAKLVLEDPDGAPYPGQDELASRVASELCDQATVDFAGASFQDIPINTLLLYPTEEEWDAGDRNVMCSATSFEEGALKIGTAAGGTLDSDEVLVARAAVTKCSGRAGEKVMRSRARAGGIAMTPARARTRASPTDTTATSPEKSMTSTAAPS